MKKKLYIVHCIDTEGPLYESIDATFERLRAVFGVDISATKENLRKIQKQEVNLGNKSKEIAKSFSKHLLAYNDTWDKIDPMLDKIMTNEYRDQFKDSTGNGIIYNWCCMDNVGFETNQRRRDLGFGNIFSHYKQKINEYGGLDSIHWHFHPLSFNKDAHISSTSYDNSYALLHQIICRRLIDHNWFPIVNRAGFHAIRQDSSFFLEQWIPFDYSNQSTYDDKNESPDCNRFGMWHRASKKWIPYHPSYNDYQLLGGMNRLTTKCLNIGTRCKLLSDEEIEHAFQDALDNDSAILAFTNHDFRDMSIDIEDIYGRINEIHKKYPSVHTINSDAAIAMRDTFYSAKDLKSEKIEFDLEVITEYGVNKIIVTLQKGKVFGSQPYLAIKTNEGRYYHDNFNEREYLLAWEYILDDATIKLSTIEKIAVASNDRYGNQSIVSFSP
jgi:hypothetical protein